MFGLKKTEEGNLTLEHWTSKGVDNIIWRNQYYRYHDYTIGYDKKRMKIWEETGQRWWHRIKDDLMTIGVYNMYLQWMQKKPYSTHFTISIYVIILRDVINEAMDLNRLKWAQEEEVEEGLHI